MRFAYKTNIKYCPMNGWIFRDGANVKGVFAWSFDGFEFNLGLKIRFGLYYVDHGLTRYARKSALWFKAMLANYSAIAKS